MLNISEKIKNAQEENVLIGAIIFLAKFFGRIYLIVFISIFIGIISEAFYPGTLPYVAALLAATVYELLLTKCKMKNEEWGRLKEDNPLFLFSHKIYK